MRYIFHYIAISVIIGLGLHFLHSGALSSMFSSAAPVHSAVLDTHPSPDSQGGAIQLGSFLSNLRKNNMFTSNVPTASPSTHFSPDENLERIDATLIGNSHSHNIDIAMYAFTDWELAQAVRYAADHGAHVRIYRDLGQFTDEQRRNNYVLSLLRENPNIEIRVKGTRTLMHVKAWSDGNVLRDGSANWSPSGEKQQDNTLTLTADHDAIHAFENDFNAMWSRTNNIIVQ